MNSKRDGRIAGHPAEGCGDPLAGMAERGRRGDFLGEPEQAGEDGRGRRRERRR